MKTSFYIRIFNILKQLNRTYGLIIAMSILFTMFFISHYWFFKYLPLTYANIDSFQYFSLQKLWDMNMPIQVGYPSYGYILFLHLISFLHDSLFAVSLTQSLLCFLSVGFLLYAIYKYIDKTFIIWTAIALGSFVAASSTLFFNTSVFPDALLSSLYILFCGSMIFMLKSKKNIFWIIFTAFIVVFSIFVRPSSLFLLPISALMIVFFFMLKQKRSAFRFIVAITVCFVVVIVHNYANPLYRSFGIIERPTDLLRPYFQDEYYNLESDVILSQDIQNKDIRNILSQIIDLLPEDNVLYAAQHSASWKELYTARNNILRGVIFRFDTENNHLQVFRNDNSYWFTVDSVVTQMNIETYILFRDSLFENIQQSEILYFADYSGLYWKTVLFRKFFSFFYDRTAAETSPLQYGNIEWRNELYKDKDKIQSTGLYTRIYAKYLDKPDVAEKLMQHSTKEFYKMYEHQTFDFVNRYAAMQQNLLFKMYDVYKLKVHFNIFQTLTTLIIFIIVFIGAVIHFFIKNFRSKTAFIVLNICLILIGLSMVHSLFYVYYRYTYSSSFVYFVILGLFPFFIQKAYVHFVKKTH